MKKLQTSQARAIVGGASFAKKFIVDGGTICTTPTPLEVMSTSGPVTTSTTQASLA